MYDTANYAGTRLNGTIVLVKRTPVYVNNVNNDMSVRGQTLGQRVKAVDTNLGEMNMTNLKLGYLNKGGVAYYMSRRAMRHDWRQGLRVNNVECVPMKNNLALEDIAQCLRQRYPSLGDAIGIASRGTSCAWCSEFCVTSDSGIYWKSHCIGSIDDDAITLRPRFKFLSKLLKEKTHECYEII